MKNEKIKESPGIEYFLVNWSPWNIDALINISKLRYDVDQANSESELIAAINNTSGRRLSFNNASTIVYFLFIAAALYNFLEGGVLFGKSTIILENIPFWVYFWVSVIMAVKVDARRRFIKKVNFEIHQKDSFIDNGIERVPQENYKKEKYNLMLEFKDFKRGNRPEKSEIEDMAQGKWKFSNGDVRTFKYIRFMYKVCTKTNKGESCNRYYRHMVILDTGISLPSFTLHEKTNKIIKSSPNPTVTTYQEEKLQDKVMSNIELDKAFNVYFKEENKHDFIKAMNPSIKLSLLEMYRKFDLLFIESIGDKICISFEDDDLTIGTPRNSIKKPFQLAVELKGLKKMPKLESIMGFYENVLKFNDNNFK